MSKRKLTHDEIENILDFIKPNLQIPQETALSVVELNKNRLRKQLVNQEVYEEIIPELKKTIEMNYIEAQISPGTSVGLLAAASIGERNTQSTLNSVDWKENILYIKNDVAIVEPIGKMIDELLIENFEKIENIEENRTSYLSLENEYFIPSCDENGLCDWYKIEAVTKHLPVGKLVKVITESGRSVTATQSKSFLVWNGEKFVATKGSDVKIGDILPTTNILTKFNNQEYFDKFKLDTEFGFIIGVFLTNKIHILEKKTDIKNRLDSFLKHSNYDILKEITENISILPNFSYTASNDFIKGLLSGFFRNCEYKDGSMLCYSSSDRIIYGIQFLLTYFKIFGFITTENDKYCLNIKNDFTKILETKVLEEYWSDLPEDLLLTKYQISNLGRLKTKETGYISQVKPRKDSNRRQAKLILSDNTEKTFFFNVLVGRTFIPNPLKKTCVDHINQIKDDDRLSNLRWFTYSENSTNKTCKPRERKKIDQYDLDGNFIKTWDNIDNIIKELNISRKNIFKVLTGKSESHEFYIWKYHIDNFEGELWKRIPNEEIEETYASNFGRIKRRNEENTITYGSLRKDGYYTISISLASSIEEKRKTNSKDRIKSKGFQVHQLVCLTFLENPEKKLYVNHKDQNRGNNKLENLEWSTNKENVNYSLDLKDRIVTNVLQKPILQIYNGEVINKYSSFVEASKALDVTKSGIQECVYGNQKTAFGFEWKYDTDEIEKNKISEFNDKNFDFDEKNVFFDKIISIDYVDGTNNYVYDLTVKTTKNFQLFNGLNIRDTFHKADNLA